MLLLRLLLNATTEALRGLQMKLLLHLLLYVGRHMILVGVPRHTVQLTHRKVQSRLDRNTFPGWWYVRFQWVGRWPERRRLGTARLGRRMAIELLHLRKVLLEPELMLIVRDGRGVLGQDQGGRERLAPIDDTFVGETRMSTVVLRQLGVQLGRLRLNDRDGAVLDGCVRCGWLMYRARRFRDRLRKVSSVRVCIYKGQRNVRAQLLGLGCARWVLRRQIEPLALVRWYFGRMVQW
uniref:Uncharacterized protein n=1 Tax=Anopheles christyi TaxID=43041 RepID=A0A182KJ10_9DIPT